MPNINTLIEHKIASNIINSKLKELYYNIPEENYAAIEEYNSFSSEHILTNPLLLAASDEYANADKKVMIIGQETYTWLKEVKNGAFSRENNPPILQSLFDMFCNNPNRKYNSAFWTFINECQKIAKQNNSGIITNNIAKVGYVGERGNDLNVSCLWGKILLEEIKICDPNMLLFVSGPLYDKMINNIFGNYKASRCIDGVTTRKLAKLEFEDGVLKGRSVYRTYHPAFLQKSINRFEWISSVYKFIDTLFQ